MKRLFGWIVLILVVIGLDQWSKIAIVAHFQEWESMPMTGFFNLVLVYNPGAAFSFLADHPSWGRWFFVALAAVICSFLAKTMWQQRTTILQPAACALIIGGAIGNVIDRLVRGRVVDFLDFHYLQHHYPSFNLADSAICLGVFLLIIAVYRENGKAGKDKANKEHTPS